MAEFKDIKKILVINLRHIGDVLLTIPAVRAVKETFPSACIKVLVNSGTEDALKGDPLIDEIIVLDRSMLKQSLFKRMRYEIDFIKRIREGHFDMAIDFTSGDRAAIISFLSGARYRLAGDPGKKGIFGKRYLYTHLAKGIGNCHKVIRNLNIVRQFGINTDNYSVDFFIPEDADAFVKKLLMENNIYKGDKIVHIHPTSRWLFKCWKDEYMAEVIRRLIEQGIKVIITSSPDEREIKKTKKILSLIPNPQSITPAVIDLCGKTTIKELAAVSKASDLFFGVDTAPMHIAAAVGTPVIALFGAGEKHWGPWGDGNIVISKKTGNRKEMSREEYIRKNLEQIIPDDVIKEINRLLGIGTKG